jgi:hypothetical protein
LESVTQSIKKGTVMNKDKLISAAWSTWSVISSDAHTLCAEHDDVLDNYGAIEFILDADRISMFGNYDPFTDGYDWESAVEVLKEEQFV